MAKVDLTPFNAILSRLEGVADRLEQGATTLPGNVAVATAVGAGAAAGSSVAAEPPIAVSFGAFVDAKMPAVQAAADTLNVKDVTEATALFVDGFRLLRSLLACTGTCRKPKDSELQQIIGPITDIMQKAQKDCDNRSDYFHNRKAGAAALCATQFATSPLPPGMVQNALEEMDFSANKVLMKKIPEETAWVKALKEFVKDLQQWCTDECKTGIPWKGSEEPLLYFADNPLGSGGATVTPKGKGKGGPPPPKGGFAAPPPEEAGAKPKAPQGGGMGAVFAAISNSGIEGGGMLKKVTADMKTKNMEKVEAKVGVVAPAGKAFAAGRGAKGPRGPPLKELQRGTNWIIENIEGDNDVTIDEIEAKHLCMVVNCKNVTVKLPNKVKSVCLDGCERVNLVCGDVISTVELVNSDNCKIQTTGKVNAFAIDKCNGVNIFLSKESLAAQIVTSKSSEMNVTIPEEGGGEYDTVEIPIPEQFVTTVTGPKSLKTEVSGIYSG